MTDAERNLSGGLSAIHRDDVQGADRRGPRTAAPIASRVPFPLESLPAALRGTVVNYSSAIGCDAAFVVMPMLPMLASCIGNARRLQLKNRWSEPSIIWALTIASSGTGKTPAFDAVMRPISKRHRRSIAEYQTAWAKYEEDLERYQSERTKHRRPKGDAEPPSRPTEPKANRLTCSDTTVEAVALLLQDQPRGLLLSRDEISGWVQSFDRYSQAQGGDVAHWLEMFNGSSMTVDRKTGKHRVIFVPSASLSISGCVQPGVLRRVLKREHFSNGLAARFLFSCPPRTQRRWSDDEVTPEMEVQLDSIVERLLSLEMSTDDEGNPCPVDLVLTPEAKQRFIAFFNEHGAEQVMLTESRSAAWSKLEAYAARLALVVHLSRWAAGESVDPSVVDLVSMQSGISITEWFCNETLRVYAMLEASDEEDEMHALADMVRASGGQVDLREWQRRRHHPNRPAAEAELDRLVRAGLGSWRHAAQKSQGGRPSKYFQLLAEGSVPETPTGSVQEGVLSPSHSADLDMRNAQSGSAHPLVESTVETTDPNEVRGGVQDDGGATAPVVPSSSDAVSGSPRSLLLYESRARDCDKTPAGSASGQVSGTGTPTSRPRRAGARALDWYESIEELAEVRVA